MDEYPAFSLDHNIPFITLLGLSLSSTSESSLPPDLKEQAVLLRSELPPVDSKHAGALLRHIEEQDASSLPWNGRDISRRYRFRVKSGGRTFFLPPRRGRLPEDFDPVETPGALHSPFSPLSPCCHLYPDGIIDGRWLEKHQDFIPSVFLCFYSLTSDATLATLHDNQIKTDINTMRNGLLQLGYKSRITVVILSDQRSSAADGTQERLDNIRKGCGLDPKTLFFVPFPGSQEELEKVADNMLASVYGQAVEYYRELGRRARKKKGRGVVPQPTVPPTSGTSQTLSLPGWNARYDFKSGIFAEFRQEMDQALRSFEQAYETLLGPDIMDMIPSWSPRWNEARQLADIISIRSLRCMLWNGQPSAAVRRWQAHRDRIGDLIDRRGRGTNNYGWKAWEARWAVVMAKLIERVEIPELSASSPHLFLQPEKTVMGERLQPWEMLHHPGYWYRAASRHLYARRAIAYAMPEEDRQAPDDSHATKAAGKAFTYDTYMCPEPHEEYPLGHHAGGKQVDHLEMIVECLSAARWEFQRRDQTRLAMELALECAREYVSARQWQKVVELVRPMWEDLTFRAERWLDISEELAWILRAGAHQTGQAGLMVSIDWELLNSNLTQRPNWHYDLTRSLEGVTVETTDEGSEVRPSVKLDDNSSVSPVSVSFVFYAAEGKAGQTAQAQLAITSNAFHSSPPLRLESIQVVFEGSIKTMLLKHGAAHDKKLQSGKTIISAVALEEESPETGAEGEGVPGLVGSCDLTLLPGHTMVYEMGVPLREPGEAKASAATLSIACDAFSMDYTTRFRDASVAGLWHTQGKSKKVSRADSRSIRIQPRPPNMEINLHNVQAQYYTNELINIGFDIVNAEDADANVKLDVLLTGDEPPTFKLLVSGGGGGGEGMNRGDFTTAEAVPVDAEETRLLLFPLGVIPMTKGVVRATVQIDPIELSTTYDLTVRASYNLVTDPATPIMQTAVFRLALINPFEANYDLLPRLNPDPWPSLFDHEGVQSPAGFDHEDDGDAGFLRPRGLSQTWCLVTRYASFATEDLRVVDVDVAIAPTPGVSCRAAKRRALPEGGLTVKPKTIEEVEFDVTAQRISLDERDPVALDVSFMIRWSRLGGGGGDIKGEVEGDWEGEGEGEGEAKGHARHVNTTRLPVPRLPIFGTEPRVLAWVSHSSPSPSRGAGKEPVAAGEHGGGTGLVHLHIVIENTSNHFLTFGLTMEPGEEFAFSGAKQTTVHLLPVSRRTVSYRLLPLVRGCWIKPNLTVKDKYFQKQLRVIPTEGMKLDKDGFLVFIPPVAEGLEVEGQVKEEEG